jgi:hypothetical protein
MNEAECSDKPEIRIDQDGKWFYRDVEMIRKDIILYFSDHLRRDSVGNYYIETESEQCPIRVDDVPYVVRTISLASSGTNGEPIVVQMDLSDGSSETLEPETLTIGNRNIIYCDVKKGRHEARFSRQAYYQLAEHIEQDPGRDLYRLKIGKKSYPLHAKTGTNGGSNVR